MAKEMYYYVIPTGENGRLYHVIRDAGDAEFGKLSISKCFFERNAQLICDYINERVKGSPTPRSPTPTTKEELEEYIKSLPGAQVQWWYFSKQIQWLCDKIDEVKS